MSSKSDDEQLIDDLLLAKADAVANKKKSKKKDTSEAYDRHLARVSERQAAATRDKQNIGHPPPDRGDQERWEAARDSLRIFYEEYFPDVFSLEWSPDHLRLIEKLERAIIHGELSALAMPRGSGKTSMIVLAAMWAFLYGYRRYISIIAASEHRSQKLLKNLKAQILHNPQIKEDFAEELWCLIKLGNRAALAGGQHVNDELTGVEWQVGRIDSGFIEGRKINNAIICCAGITGEIRGEQSVARDGSIIRPDLVLCDDPQTKSSAASKSQCTKRHETLMGDVLGMAGPGKSIAGLCACTIIYANDMAARLLDMDQSPDWQGETCKMIYEWPDRLDLWDEYRVIYESELRESTGHDRSTDFVIENFDEMHRGSKPGWAARFDRKKEVSATHHAFNLKFRDEGAFQAEYQNDPLMDQDNSPFDLKATEIAERCVPSLFRNELPEDCELLTAAIDVQQNMLFYSVTGFTGKGRAYTVDYGTFPEQKRNYFTKRDANPTLQEVFDTEDVDTCIAAGLVALTRILMEKEYDKGDAAPLMIEKLGVDTRYKSRIVRRFCRESEFKSRLHPVMGQYIGPNSKQWQRLAHGKRDKRGVHCKLQPPANKERGRPELLIDVNWWKTLIATRLSINEQSERAIVLFQDSPANHRLFSEHLTAETPMQAVGKSGNIVTIWEDSRQDHDWWDTMVYSFAMASTIKPDIYDDSHLRKQKATRSGGTRNSNAAVHKRMQERAKQNKSMGEKGSARERMEKRRKKK